MIKKGMKFKMLNASNPITIGIMSFLCVLLTILSLLIINKKNKKQLDKIFIITFGCFV